MVVRACCSGEDGSGGMIAEGDRMTGEASAEVVRVEIGAESERGKALRRFGGGKVAEGGGRRTEGGGRKAVLGGRRTVGGGWRAEDGGRRTVDGGRVCRWE